MAGKRLQQSRRRGGHLPPGAKSVAGTSRWANPYRPPSGQRSPEANAAAVAAYRKYLAEHPELVEQAREELAGHDLACYCAPDLPCHVDVLLEILASDTKETA
ncbi:protein of unknown function [Nocardioides sp. YR527]|uniref:DUF4326 domain-containing protein n=1 Tax=Nocardioides sp. YR527 TaxID=1881028 RepID=UPI000886AF83|nr:DUF4326 domain-containing protein [Nocardioides sp. YR527]SDL33789.1 protein of unknown function [Nocardioides sp. YR527]